MRPRHGVDIVRDEIRVFEPAQHRYVDNQAGNQPDLRAAVLLGGDGPLDSISDHVIERDGKQQ